MRSCDGVWYVTVMTMQVQFTVMTIQVHLAKQFTAMTMQVHLAKQFTVMTMQVS
jgi:hypothetical protein